MSLDAAQVLKPFRKVRKELKKPPQQITPERVHKFRTNLRRIEAALDAFALASKRPGKRALREEKQFRRLAGKVRDMDVLSVLARSIDIPADNECGLELIESLGAQRYKQASKFDRLARADGPVLRQRLKRCCNAIEQQIGDQADGNRAAANVAGRAIEICTELNRFPALNKSNLHEFRLRVKHVRYMLQMARSEDAALVKALGEVKDKVGEWHDWLQLGAVTRENITQNSREDLLRKIDKTADSKFREAMRVAQQLRDRYLASFQVSKPPMKKRKGKPATGAGPTLVVRSIIAA